MLRRRGRPQDQAADRAILPLARAAEAHRLIESGEARGKIVLDPTLE
jgi:NADPH:quinone reductase-like Zn-dependent oxidoreductase